MNKEIYNYAKVEAYIESERKADKEKMIQQKQSFSQPRSKPMTTKDRTGDPFKDFSLEMSMVQQPEAQKYINLGREQAYDYIDMLYRKDWHEEKKINGVKLSYIASQGDPVVFFRVEAKFEKITVKDLVEYFTSIDKRMAWDGANF